MNRLEHTKIWECTCRLLKEKMHPSSYQQWIAGITPVSLEGTLFTLGVSDDFFGSWIEEHYGDIIIETLEIVTEQKLTLEFTAGEQFHTADEEVDIPLEKEEPVAKETPSTESKVNRECFAQNCLSRHTFANFVVGEENRYAFAASEVAAKTPGLYNPLYIYGGTGTGKTHLLQAIAHETKQRNPEAIVRYITCEDLLNQFVGSIKSRTHDQFRNHFRNVDIFLLDDVHQLGNKTQLQEEFFNTFNTLYNLNKQIVLTSDKQPSEIPGLEARLVSRFESGVATEIQLPGLETRLAILRMKQEEHLTKLNDDVLYFIASRVTSSIRQLEGALLQLIAYSSAMSNCEITLDIAENLLSRILEKEVSSRKNSIENIQKTVAEYFGIQVHDILSKKRPKNIAEPRMIAMYLARNLTDYSFPEIGNIFGKNHATVINAHKKISSEYEKNEEMRHTIKAIQRQLGN